MLRKEEALTTIERFRTDFPENRRYNNLFYLLKSALDDSETSTLSVDSDLEKWAKKDASYALFIAECYSLKNAIKQAMDWLEISINLGGINYPFLNDYNTLLENIRGESRFREMMERVKQEWKEFKI